MAAVSSVTRLSNLHALLAISVLASLVAVGMIYKLWGGWVALAFVILSREWLERSLLGGAEPLFLALLFSGFLAARREKWGLAALLASLATVVRPMGIFGLVGIGLVLIQRREYRKFALASAIGSGIGLLYILPLKLYFGDPMANVRGYDHADWSSNSAVTFPFAAIVHNALAGGSTRLNVARTVVWIAFILAAAALMVISGNLLLYTTAPTEIIFWALYLLFLFTYNSSWAWEISSLRNPPSSFFRICGRAMDSQKLLASVCFRSAGGCVVGGRDSWYCEHSRSSEAGPLAPAVLLEPNMKTVEAQPLHRIGVVFLLIAATVEFSARGPVRIEHSQSWNDFISPYIQSRLWVHGEDPYRSENLVRFWPAGATIPSFVLRESGDERLIERRGVPSPYPPTSFVLLAPLALLPWKTALWIWIGLSVAAIAVTLLALASVAGIGLSTLHGLLFLALCLGLAPLHTGLATANPAILGVALAVVALWFAARRQDVFCGLLIAGSMCLKPTIGVCFLFFISSLGV